MSAAVDSMGNEIYIGRGPVDGIVMPGPLFIQNSGNKLAGLYVEYLRLERRLTTNIEYYSINPMCDYKWLPSSNGTKVINAIIANPNKYYVGRVKVDGLYQIGKVLLNRKLFYGKGFSRSSYEVLTCDSKIRVGKI